MNSLNSHNPSKQGRRRVVAPAGDGFYEITLRGTTIERLLYYPDRDSNTCHERTWRALPVNHQIAILTAIE